MIAATQTRIDDRKSFQKLKTTLHRRLVDSIDLSAAPPLDERELRDQLRALAAHLCSRERASVPEPMREMMVQEIMDEIYGFGPLEPLMNDADVGDIHVNGPDSVWVERDGALEETDVRFADEAHLLRLIQRLVSRAGRRIDEQSPMVEARLPDGSRLNAVIGPLARRGPTLSLRRFRSCALEIEEIVRRGTLAPEMADFLIAAVRGRLNVLISGGTGAGKTRLLNSLCRFIPRTDRVVTIEQTAELQLGQSNVVSLEANSDVVSLEANADGRGDVTLCGLLKQSLRLRPDRVILGEARGAEVFEFLQAMNTGLDGSMTTIHANDARDALDRLEVMMSMSGQPIPLFSARQYVASALPILVHIARLASGERKILRISELCGYRDGEYQIEDIYICRMAGFDDEGRSLSTFYATGYEPASLVRLASLGYETPRELFVPRELGAGREYALYE
jgi:pilus assembly protein CpaF